MNTRRFNLLIVDDEEAVISQMKRTLRRQDCSIFSARSGYEALKFDIKAIDGALIDMRMPGMNGLELLKRIKDIEVKIQVVIFTGYSEIEQAVTAMRLGAVDYLEKPFRNEKLIDVVEQMERFCQPKRENDVLKEQISFTFGNDRMIGDSPPMQKLKKMIRKVGPTDTSVLVLGETGTGKELIARALHKNSPRHDEPFIPVDCAAISENMIESELFGHEKGAYTGAERSTTGLMKAADRGTLFFDEVGELPLHVQSKLLRSLQQREIRPVGSTETVPLDIRIISATNRDLLQEVESGRFRKDLYYRLNVVCLKAPALLERREDIPILANYFLQKNAIGDYVNTIEDEGLEYLSNYFWPGNIRELENCIKRLIAFSEKSTIGLNEIRSQFELVKNGQTGDEEEGTSFQLPVGWTMLNYEEYIINMALEKCCGKRKDAARLLNIGEATLYRKIKKFSLYDD